MFALQGRFSQEGKQDAGLAYLEENVMARFLAHDPQAKDSSVEILGGVEVINVNGGLDDGFEVHGDPLALARD